MSLEKQLRDYKKIRKISPRENEILETVRKSGEAFFASEQDKVLSYHEFLWLQLKVVRKRWWVLQLILLFVLGGVLLAAQEDKYIQRSMGVAATLFVILIIPEFWKNRSCRALEVEAVSFYSLRQIYAARMMLFGIADTFLLTLFCGSVSFSLGVAFKELLVQFLFPLCVTACICFGSLCSRYILQEAVAVGLCILWSGVWLLIILNEHIYTNITLPVWAFLWGLALVSLFAALYRVLIGCDKYWEVSLDGIEI